MESLFKNKNKTLTLKLNVSSLAVVFSPPQIRTEFYPKAVRSVRTSHSKRPGVLCGDGAAPQRVLSQCRVGRGHGERGGDVAGARHETLGPGRQVRPQLLLVQPLQLGPHPDRHGAREQVGQRQRWVSLAAFRQQRSVPLSPRTPGPGPLYLCFPSVLPFLCSFRLSFCLNTVKPEKWPWIMCFSPGKKINIWNENVQLCKLSMMC